MNKEIKWEESGLLDGLDLSHKQALTDLLNQTAEIHNKSYYENERVGTLLFPCIRKIYSILFLEENNYNNIQIEDLDIRSIIIELDKLVPVIMLLKQNFFKNSDIEAELTVIFCYNYIRSIKN